MRKERKEPKVGGLVFLMSLLFLMVLNALFLLLIPSIFSGRKVLINWIYFLTSAAAGWFCASVFVAGHLQVFLHELNHKVLSGLVGNRPKRLKVGKEEGFFEYEYTKETAAYNAFISLAPYFFPLFTILAFVLALIGWRNEHVLAVSIVGVAYGVDLCLNTRSISPHQSDFSSIIGGYALGFLYVTLITIAIFFVLASWVSNGLEGMLGLLTNLFRVSLSSFSSLSGKPVPFPWQ